MKKSLFILVALVFLAGTAHAERLLIGDKTITYSVPGDYFKGDKEPYTEMRGLLTRVSPKDMQIFGLYISRDSDAKLREGKAERVENYFVLASLRPLQDKILSSGDFEEAKKQLVKIQEQIRTRLLGQANKLIGSATNGTMAVGDINTFGAYDVTDTSISFLALTDQITRVGNRQVVDKQAVVSTYLLADGKIVVVNQYQLLTPKNVPEQLNAFKARARGVIKDLRIKEGTPKGSFMDSYLVKVAGGAIIGAIIGVVITLIRKRKKTA